MVLYRTHGHACAGRLGGRVLVRDGNCIKGRRLNAFTVFTFSSLSPAPFITMAEKQAVYPVNTQPGVCVYPASYITDRGNSSYFHVSQGVAPMKAGGNRNAKNLPIKSDGKRDWSHGLFGCFDSFGTCQ
jgi:hypothetical protein